MIFNSECTRNRLSAGLYPDPLGELTALPRPPMGWRGPLKRVEEERRGKRVERREDIAGRRDGKEGKAKEGEG